MSRFGKMRLVVILLKKKKKKNGGYKRVKLKHNNPLVNKFMNTRLNLTMYNIIFLYVYLSKNIFI